MKQNISQILQANAPIDVEAEGWIATVRTSKNVTFLALGDGSCAAHLQIVIGVNTIDRSLLSQLGVGAAIRCTGTLVPSLAAGQRVELQAQRIDLIGAVDPDYPLQKKRHSFEFLRTIAHLRPRTRTFGAVFRVRHALQMAIHRFFDDRGFIQVHTPIITTADCEGAGQMFHVTTLDLDAPPRTNDAVDYAQDFFKQKALLTVSGQLEAEVFALAFKNVYTFGPTFRAENSNTARHAAEFWMVEPEMAFCDLAGDMALAEAFMRRIISDVLTRCEADMDFFDQWIEKGLVQRLEKVVQANFAHMTYTEAISALQQSNESFAYPVSWGLDLQSEHERWLTEKHVGRPVFITDYPRGIKAFYMRLSDDERTVAAMDLLVPGVGEIIGGSQREERREQLQQQLHFFKLNPADYDWYLDLRRFGGVPHAGFGLGFERALMYITGMQNIRDVIPFARTPGHASF
ncbi:MAG: asparagine--tRNA ligase [Proteobacteria bacterium]|nr:asparagine--tRNA ligase [Pseudomonadota bacterium]